MAERTDRERLTELAEGWECAALAEQGVMAKFQADLEMFNAGERDAKLIRHVRVYCEARDNRNRFEADAAAIRRAIEHLPAESNSSSPNEVSASALPPDEPTILNSSTPKSAGKESAP